MNKKKTVRNLLFAILAVVLMASGNAYGQTGQGLLRVGPVATGPLKLFPGWYMDSNGLALEACVSGPPLCLSSLAELGNPNVGEAFYWLANADLADPSGANGFVELALEMAFLNPVINRANAMVFNRLRVRIDNLPAAGTYTITHPFGQLTADAVATPNRGFRINVTSDLPGTAGRASFIGVLRAPNIGPFLVQTGAPRGFIGNPNVALPVTGGTNGNSVTVTGPLAFSMTTDLFQVQGKRATNGGLSRVRANFSKVANGPRTVNVSASSIGGQRIVANIGTPPLRVVLAPVAGQIGQYTGTITVGQNRSIEPLIVRNTTDASRPSVTFTTVPDVVTITSATWVNGVLTVQASSSNLGPPRPILRLIDPVSGSTLQTGRGAITASSRTPIKPARVRVVSSSGGAATAVVQ